MPADITVAYIIVVAIVLLWYYTTLTFKIVTASQNSYSSESIVSHFFPVMSHHLWRNLSGFHITVATTLTGVRHLYLFYFAMNINRQLWHTQSHPAHLYFVTNWHCVFYCFFPLLDEVYTSGHNYQRTVSPTITLSLLKPVKLVSSLYRLLRQHNQRLVWPDDRINTK